MFMTFVIRARRKVATEKDFLDAVHKVRLFVLFDLIICVLQVIKSYAKFSATPKYMTYN